MPRVNLSRWAVTHRTLMLFFMMLIIVMGVRAYFSLGQNEDPPYTFKAMVVKAYLPGASMDETLNLLTDRIERKLQETPSLDFLKSYTLPGETTIFVNLAPDTAKDAVPGIWYQVRKKTGDIAAELPPETVGPFFNDEFGDTYGIIYAFTSDGFTHRELKDIVDRVRSELLHVKDVAKIITIGVQDEKYFIEFSPHTLANIGISREAVVAALQRQNALTPSGTIDTGSDKVVVETTGRFTCTSDIENVTVHADGRKLRIGDIATVTHGYSDPPTPLFRFNGRDAIGLGVSMRSGGDVIGMERNMTKAMERLRATLPVGIEEHLVANQPAVVKDAVREFTKTLFEAVAIVLILSFLTLGIRAGTVVACSIPFVLALVFVSMWIAGIDLQRISLGALIIALGLLVDDAMITIECMISRIEQGQPLEEAATFSYVSVALPMLTGTLVTIFGFIPVGLAKSSAGEYCFSLFAVVALALLFSWFVAVLLAPPIGVMVLKGFVPKKREWTRRLAVRFDAAVLRAMRHPVITVVVTLALFAGSLLALPLVPQQFFPTSERPELLVDLTLRQGVSITATDTLSKRLDAMLADDPDVSHWSSYVGQGAIRFYLPLDQQLQNDFFTQTVIVTKGGAARERVRRRIQAALDHDFPEAYGRVSPMELGPPVGWPVSYRISGPDTDTVVAYARKVADCVAASPHLRNISFNWGEQCRMFTIDVRQEEARRLGLSSAAIAGAVASTMTGVAVTRVRDGIYLVDVVLRADRLSRDSIEDLRALSIPLPAGGTTPLGVVAEVGFTQGHPLVWRRDRQVTLTVQADVWQGIMPKTAVAALQPGIDAIRASLPAGFAITDGGTVEESAKSLKSVLAAMPVMIILMLCVLMIQLQDFMNLFLVLVVAPLGIIGVVAALLVSRMPMGYVSMLGIIALVGMIVRNSVILVHQIDVERSNGLSPWDAVIAAARVRVRPIMLTAVAAILGMVPIAPTVFWGPMAYAIMGGLAVATVLTLVFLPSCYVLCYRINEPPSDGGAV